MKNNKAKIIIIFLIILVSPIFAQAALTDNIISYYNFTNENDATGYSNMTPSYTVSYETGLIGNATSFRGTDSKTYYNITTPILPTSVNNFSFSFWIKSNSTATNQFFIDKSASSNPRSWIELSRSSAGDIAFVSNNGGGYNIDITSANSLWNNNTWVHIVVVRNGTNAVIYVNGIEKTSTNNGVASGAINANTTLRLGVNEAITFNVYVNALVDEFGVWYKALNYTEVLELYNYGLTGVSYPFSTSTPEVIVWSFLNQSPSDITTSTFGFLNITYNSSMNMNVSSVYLNYTITNSTTSINGTALPAYLQTTSTNKSMNWSTLLGDNEYFSGVYNYNESIVESTVKSGAITLTGSNDYALISLINVRNDTLYNIFEVMMNTSLTGSASIYYCNSSYTTGAITSNANCIQIGTFNGTGFNHTHNLAYNYSRHNLFSVPVQNGGIGTVKISNTSYFIIKRETGIVYVHYANLTSPRPTAFRTSGNKGNTYTNLAATFLVDAHLHQYTGYNYFVYQQCGTNTSGTFNCSSFRSDLIDLSALNPTSPQVVSPSNQDYNYTTDILFNWTDAITYINTTTIKNYTYSLLTNNSVLVNYFYGQKTPIINTTVISASVNTTILNIYPNNYITGVSVTAKYGSEISYFIVGFCSSTCVNSSKYTMLSSTFYETNISNPTPNNNITRVLYYLIHNESSGTSSATNLTSLNKSFIPNVQTTGTYLVRIDAYDSNNLNSYGVSVPFNITSILNVRLQDNYTLLYVSNFSGWLYNDATGYNQSFSTGTGTLATLNVYSGSNQLFIEQSNYSTDTNNYFNFTLSTTPQTYNKTFQLEEVNSVHIEVYNQQTDVLINTNDSTVTISSSTYNNVSNTTNGGVQFKNLPADNYTVLVSNPAYITGTFQIVVYNASSQYLKARLLPNSANTSIAIYVKNQLYQPVESALITVQRQFGGGSWATVTQVLSDVNGFNYIYLQDNTYYRFIISASGYSTKQFDMNVYSAVSPYTFVITTTASSLYTNYFGGVNYYYSPTTPVLNQSVYWFSITTYNSSLDIQWTSVTVSGITVNVTGSPSGATANISKDLSNYQGALNVTYQFYFYNANTSTYSLFKIPVTYFVNPYNTTQTSLTDVWTDFRTDVETQSPTGQVWTTIIAMFLILAIIITLIQLSGSQIVGLIGGVAGLAFFAVVGMLSPVFAFLTGTIILILLFMNRG